MNDSLQELATWAAPLLARLRPIATRQLMRRIAASLASSQTRRIRQQQNPDGTPYAPRKVSAARAALAGSVRARVQARGAMFAKLGTRTHLKAKSDAEAVTVGFLSRAARIARVHQYGLMDTPAPGQAEVRYPARELLGFTEADRAMVRDHFIDAIKGHHAP